MKRIVNPNQLDLFLWSESRPKADVIDLIPAIIKRMADEPWPPVAKDGELVTLRRNVA